ncbi:MAG: c-type cytochrome [Candidatus Pedobacter colombiensis]|uniref:C-type cytochrome n=1 Tax=Candidatus Pedobacter colombiensis TaxID=3121371 RepID=A0AAJ6B6B0_9SPHI|nr:c-type cytochrome [Pedobacter sp.]WEK18739.1 MAG: c-type cytochrome [Pedobacter sp.]
MKKTLFILGCFVLAMASCSSPEERSSTTSSATTTETPATPTETTAKAETTAPKGEGEKLIAKSDCIGCHNKVQKVIGPAYVDIAAKYPLNDENVNHLADKIIAGGKGVWGEIPMTPHSALSKDDAKKMVSYILSLKK